MAKEFSRNTGGEQTSEEARGQSTYGQWIITWADLIMLLFCFFVLLAVKSAATEEVEESTTTSTSSSSTTTTTTTITTTTTTTTTTSTTMVKKIPVKECKGISLFMNKHKENFQNYQLSSTPIHCIITLPDKFLFDIGKAKIRNEDQLIPLFKTINELEEHKGDLIIIEGHTDDLPIVSGKYSDNWELSSARATSVANFLIEKMNFSPDRIQVSAYSKYRPKKEYVVNGVRLKGKELEEARKINRRVEIILGEKHRTNERIEMLYNGYDN